MVIHRRRELRASKSLQEAAFAEPKIEFLWDMVVEEIEGGNEIKAVKLRQVKTGEVSTLKLAGIFIAIGFRPNTTYLKEVVTLDNGGYIITNELMETETPGIFAAGDIRRNSARQAITAAGDGATAALSAEKFLREIR
jgi:thioredoxin reductase (NADPH)